MGAKASSQPASRAWPSPEGPRKLPARLPGAPQAPGVLPAVHGGPLRGSEPTPPSESDAWARGGGRGLLPAAPPRRASPPPPAGQARPLVGGGGGASAPRPARGSESESGAAALPPGLRGTWALPRGAGMASPPAAEGRELWARVSPAGRPGERLDKKLQRHFQSERSSGGGECEVRPHDPARGLYRLLFRSPHAKSRVQASEYHFIMSGDQTLKVQLLQDFKEMDFSEKSFPQSLTSQAPSITEKIFLSVSATLNTDLFTREERDKVTELWPTLKIEKCSSELGVEEVTGDYGVVEELHGYFEGLLPKSYHGGESTNPPRQKDLERRTVNDQKEGAVNGAEESSNMQVPSAIFEYFTRVCKGEIKDLEQKFSIKLTSVEDNSGMTSVQFVSAGSPGCLEEAQQALVTAFQKVAADLKQESIPLADTRQVVTTSEMLNTIFKSILVKPQGNTLILRGPAKDLSAAKELVKGMEVEGLPKKSEVSFFKTGILVDTDVFEFLEPKLMMEIQSIKQMYGAVMEKRKSLNNQKAYIIFKPETTKKTPDGTSKAYETFFRAYTRALETPTEKTIISKHSVDLGKKVNEFFTHLQTKNPKVLLKETEDKLILFGLPVDVCSAEKHILQYLNTLPHTPHSGTLSSPHSAKAGTSSGASLEYHKGHSFPTENPSFGKAAKAEPEEKCSICMDKIDQKEVLPKCKHAFCRRCIQKAMTYKPVCPVCNVSYGKIEGNQPPGTMKISKEQGVSLPGYEGFGTIRITYHIFDGVQKGNHPNPGRSFIGTTRIAYLPDNGEGREILKLLQQAFDQKLIFTVGQSRTTGLNDVVTWNDIHHKTSIYGGANGFGYPDPNYLKRVREELKAKGIE